MKAIVTVFLTAQDGQVYQQKFEFSTMDFVFGGVERTVLQEEANMLIKKIDFKVDVET